MLPGESTEEAWDRYTQALWHMTWKYSDMEASANRPGPPPPPPELTDELRSGLTNRFTLAGKTDEMVSTLLDVREKAGLHVEFAARSHFATLEYRAQVELMQRLAEEVAPHL